MHIYVYICVAVEDKIEKIDQISAWVKALMPPQLYCEEVSSRWASSPGAVYELGFSQGGNDLLGSRDLNVNMKGHVTQSCRSHMPCR